MNEERINNITKHYEKAKQLHPHFCDTLYPGEYEAEYRGIIRAYEAIKQHHEGIALRRKIKDDAEVGALCWTTLIEEQMLKVRESMNILEKGKAIESCYDGISIFLRVIDVLEGNQSLGAPKDTTITQAQTNTEEPHNATNN